MKYAAEDGRHSIVMMADSKGRQRGQLIGLAAKIRMNRLKIRGFLLQPSCGPEHTNPRGADQPEVP
ncbi:hypothetical protein CCMA1212_005874 [Trichoderma ghanense]|uniref:Uncharacterized protein n=1 Tax=Trichoderma ghanense TaxID=65468 RepID=A0ABY2H217_9HYPO